MARPKKTANGNGRNGHFDPANMRTTEDGQLVVDDLVPASVLLMFFIQKLGQASLDQLGEKVKAAAVQLNVYLLAQAVEALRARQFVSYAKGRVASGDGDGEIITQFKPRKVMFAGIPETAQITNSFLSTLVSTPDAEELITALNADEEEGAGTAKSTEKLRYADYYGVEVSLVTTSAMLGGRPSSPYFDALVERGPKAPTKCDMRFPRNAAGWPIVPESNVRGWLEGACRRFNITPAAVQYLGISGGKIEFPDGVKSIQQHAQPVVDLSGRGGGRGISTYEILPAGARITFVFNIPSRGAVTPAQFEAMLTAYAPTAARGLSNARSNEYGRAMLVEFKQLGEMDDAETAIRAAMSSMGDEGRERAEKLIAGFKGKRLNMRNGKTVEVD